MPQSVSRPSLSSPASSVTPMFIEGLRQRQCISLALNTSHLVVHLLFAAGVIKSVRRCVPVVLGPVLFHKHRQRHLHPLRFVRVVQPLQHSSAGVLAVRLARLHQQLSQPANLHHLQRRVPQGVQETAAEAVPLILMRQPHLI